MKGRWLGDILEAVIVFVLTTAMLSVVFNVDPGPEPAETIQSTREGIIHGAAILTIAALLGTWQLIMRRRSRK